MFVPVHVLFVLKILLPPTLSTYVLLHNWFAVVGAIVDVDKLVLNVFVPVHVFEPLNRLVLTAVSAVST